ncbi:MAG: glycosyltransferase family 4 protein [Patescibacteria group bacterium]
MKIFLPFTVKGIGGTATFALKFKEGMESLGHEVFFEYRPDYDVLLTIVQAPFRYLLDAKKRKKKIIQRLDGTWYWTVAGWKFPLYNLKAQIIRHWFADFTIYQSAYSQFCSEVFLGKKQHDRSALIYNGVDLSLFSPLGDTRTLRDNKEQRIFFTASAFRRADQILPLLQALKIYQKKYGDNFKCLVAGTFSKKVASLPQKWSHFKQVEFLGKIDNKDLPAYERGADVFLFTHLNPPCPNNILEAMACGLPICGVDDGAMAELVQTGKNGLLLETKGTGFWKKRALNLGLFADNLAQITKNQKAYSEESRRIAEEKFSLKQMLERYANVIQ